MEQKKEARFDEAVRKLSELSGVYRNAAARSGISVNEFWIWQALTEGDQELTQQEICTAWGIPKQTVNTIVRNMVRKKYAVLEAVPLNRSRKRIRLTPAGLAFGKELVERSLEAERSAFYELPEEIRMGMLRFLDAYIPLMRQRAGMGAL